MQGGLAVSGRRRVPRAMCSRNSASHRRAASSCAGSPRGGPSGPARSPRGSGARRPRRGVPRRNASQRNSGQARSMSRAGRRPPAASAVRPTGPARPPPWRCGGVDGPKVPAVLLSPRPLFADARGPGGQGPPRARAAPPARAARRAAGRGRRHRARRRTRRRSGVSISATAVGGRWALGGRARPPVCHAEVSLPI